MGRGAWRATVHVVTKTEQLTNKFLELEMVTHSSILPWKSHGQRSLAGYSPWDHKESDTTERLSMHAIYIKAQMVPEAASGALKTASESFGHTLLML